MFAALKGTIIDAVIYCGEDPYMYPDWMYECVLDACFIDNYGSKHIPLTDESDDVFTFATLFPYESVVLRNKWEELHYTTFNIFQKLYLPMSSETAALIEDCVEYFVFTNNKPLALYPGWVRELSNRGEMFRRKSDVWYVQNHKETKLIDGDIILRNHRGNVRYIGEVEFNRLYSTGYISKPDLMIEYFNDKRRGVI